VKHSYKALGAAILAIAWAVAFLVPGQSYGQKGMQAKLGIQYTHFEYGRLHGLQVPFSLSYQVNNAYFGFAVGWGLGFSDWNYAGDPAKNYNLDINRQVPPWAFWQVTTFTDGPRPNELKGGTGYGQRSFLHFHAGYQLKVFNRVLAVEGGAYLTRVTTSFIAAKAEDVMVYNALASNHPDLVFPTDLLFPVSVIYYDLGPFVGMSYQIAKDWRVPLGVSASYYYGFYDNSWVNVGLCFFLPVSKSLR